MTEIGDLSRPSAVVHSAANWETLIVTGPERLTWLDGLVTCEVKALTPGQGTWGLVLNRQGKIQTPLWMVADSDQLWLAVAPGTRQTVRAELDRMLIMEDAELDLPQADPLWFTLHGPAASQRAAELSQLTAARCASIDFLGLGGAALVVPSAHGAAFREAAAPELLDDDAWLLLRLERGFPEYGVDYEGRERPHEAALDRRAVSWSKGCYLGQEVVCMQDMRGKVRRSLRVLFVEAPQDGQVTAGALLADPAGKQVGEVTSCAYSTRAGGWLAMSRMELSALDGPLKLTTTTDQQYSAKPADVV